MARSRALIAAAAWLLVLAPHRADAQRERPRPHPELRADAFFARPNVIQAGAGVQIPLGYYTRLGVLAAGGVADGPDVNGVRASARADVLMRYLLDPFGEARWGISLGGGVSVRSIEGERWRPYLTLLVDIESGRARSGGWRPALQVGLGGGARVGVALRRGAASFR